MEIISLKCNNCGANLQINKKTVYLQCTSCGSSLAVKKSINTVFTEVLEELNLNTNKLVDQSNIVLIEKEIERLDREWMIEREKYRISTKDGNHLPDESESNNLLQYIVFITSFLFFGGIMVFLLSDAPAEFKPFILGGLLIFIVGVFISFVSVSNKTSDYKQAKTLYLEKRQSLLKKLEP